MKFITVVDDRDRQVALNTSHVTIVTAYNGYTRVKMRGSERDVNFFVDVKMSFKELVALLNGAVNQDA